MGEFKIPAFHYGYRTLYCHCPTTAVKWIVWGVELMQWKGEDILAFKQQTLLN
ncbi:MAG: hypothetical protein V3T17_16080 [Pseudomonadales bacterium]